jgi:glycosyltransferase involved in cell wall biosynthesis
VQKDCFVFSMGRIWDEAKNIKLLTDASPFINVPVKIAGGNSFDENNFRTSAGNAIFLGKLSTQQVAAQLAAASVYVLPATYEPFGLSVLEAALSGCALVLGDIPSLREIWQDAAIYVDTENARALAETVNVLLADRERLRIMGQKAKSRAAIFSTERMAQHYWKEYQHLVQHKQNLVKEETI